MRMMVTVELDTPTANQALVSGTIAEVVPQLMEQLKPEAAYFLPLGGRRGVVLFVDVPDASSIVTTCEQFWLQLNAKVEMTPCMNADELEEGIRRVTQ
jgi:hypothetical protein